MITCEIFGYTSDGAKVLRYTMQNSSGMTVRLLTYGATVQNIFVPDRNGERTDVVLGYDDLLSYEKGSLYFGATVGRYANRIKGAAFTLNGKRYRLKADNAGNHNHGVFHQRVFDSGARGNTVFMHYVSPDGEDGFPGRLNVEVAYRLTDGNALEITYTATADADTVLNLTNHSYFNLNGHDNVLGHRLRLFSDSYTEADETGAPTGEIKSVIGTPLDFTGEKAVGRDIHSPYPPLARCHGYDHNYVLENDGKLREFAILKGDQSGIIMTCRTTQPAFQLYTANYVEDCPIPGKCGVSYTKYAALCLETQHYPASPNYPHFPSTVLRKGETFRERTIYQFSI